MDLKLVIQSARLGGSYSALSLIWNQCNWSSRNYCSLCRYLSLASILFTMKTKRASLPLCSVLWNWIHICAFTRNAILVILLWFWMVTDLFSVTEYLSSYRMSFLFRIRPGNVSGVFMGRTESIAGWLPSSRTHLHNINFVCHRYDCRFC